MFRLTMQELVNFVYIFQSKFNKIKINFFKEVEARSW
jgi:hypothetical protein